MRTGDLLFEHSLQLRLHTPSSSERLKRPISGSAPTELMDPTPFLNPHTVVLSNGIGFNFADDRTWHAYVERLATAKVSALAFSTGTAHRVLPRALIDACAHFDLPLLEVPAVIPLLQVDRHIEQVLQQEHLVIVNRGLKLADECARLANSGADLSTIMATIYSEIGAPLAIYDSYGSVISRFPAGSTWAPQERGKHVAGETRITLPMGMRLPCLLAVKLDTPGLDLESLLGSAASVLALQLNQRQASHEHRQGQVRQLLAQCVDWEDAKQSDISQTLRSIGIEFPGSASVLIANMEGEFAATSWQLRVALHECFHAVFLAEINGRLIALAQQPRIPLDQVEDRLLSIRSDQPLVLKLDAQSLEEFRLAIVHAQDLVKHARTPQLVPELMLSSIIAVTSGRGASEAASNFLRPLHTHDSKRAITLMPTLEAFLRNDAHPSRTCDELFIHRNTLSYRLRRIESLLGVDLTTLEAQATCLLALRLAEQVAE